MPRKLPILRVAGPTILVSVVLFAACSVSAFFLYRLHAETAEGLADDLDSRKKAVEIETTLRNLITLVRTGSDQVEALHARLDELLEDAHELVSSDAELALQARLQERFERYREAWDTRLDGEWPSPQHAQKVGLAALNEAVADATALRNFNSEQIERSEAELKKTIKWFAWGLVAVGCVGSLGGVLLGYGVARALRQSIHRLSVRIRDAADKLGHDLPTVTLHQGDGIEHLHEQMQSLMREIEQMVGQLQQREREVLRAEQMAAVGQLAAGVAHELRNPLTAVKMLLETSREDLESRGVPSEDLAIIEQEVRRLEKSLQAFLDFARPPKMQRRRTDLVEIIDQALALVSGRTRKQGVGVEFDPGEAPLWIEADGEQLRQLLVNLAMNALDAMPAGGKLIVRIARPRPAEAVEVHVIDTGPGVSPDVMPRLFQPFVSSKETGLGLGLVVSRRIAEEHGGRLTAVNLAQGACFTLRLPAPQRVAMAV